MSAVRLALRKATGWWKNRETAPGGDTASWAARCARETAIALDDVRARMAAVEAELARQASLRACGLEGVRRALTVAGVEPPEALAAEVATAPMLRVVV